jgi:hypothetical protein
MNANQAGVLACLFFIGCILCVILPHDIEGIWYKYRSLFSVSLLAVSIGCGLFAIVLKFDAG